MDDFICVYEIFFVILCDFWGGVEIWKTGDLEFWRSGNLESKQDNKQPIYFKLTNKSLF